MAEQHKKDTDFPVEVTLGVIGGKWKTMILWHLMESNPRRNNELKKLLPGITQKVLTKQLRELESHGLINRAVYAEIPPKVEYSLTKYGKTLTPVIRQMHEWGTQHSKNHKK